MYIHYASTQVYMNEFLKRQQGVENDSVYLKVNSQI